MISEILAEKLNKDYIENNCALNLNFGGQNRELRNLTNFTRVKNHKLNYSSKTILRKFKSSAQMKKFNP